MTLRVPLRTALATASVLTASMVAGCGSTPARVTSGLPATPATALPIATSLAGSGNADWAVIQLGGSSAHHENFWELFVRPAGSRAWQLATPPGVASNGGLILASAGPSVIAGFRPSQQLTFSPLAMTTDQGKSWSQGNLVSPGLAAGPDALAAGPDGQLLALTDTGTVRVGTHLGASWRALAGRTTLADTAAGRACGLVSLSAVAFDGAGTPAAGGACRTPGVVGLFTFGRGGWQPAGLKLPAAFGHLTVSVLGLAAFSGRTTALLAIGHGAAASIVAAWRDREHVDLVSGTARGRASVRVPVLVAGRRGRPRAGRVPGRDDRRTGRGLAPARAASGAHGNPGARPSRTARGDHRSRRRRYGLAARHWHRRHAGHRRIRFGQLERAAGNQCPDPVWVIWLSGAS